MLHGKCFSKYTTSILLVFLIAGTYSCISIKRPERSITAFLGCDSEAYYDLLYSVESISEYAELNGIDIRIIEKSDKCGYSLFLQKEKHIEEVLTDYDLMMEMKTFFEGQRK